MNVVAWLGPLVAVIGLGGGILTMNCDVLCAIGLQRAINIKTIYVGYSGASSCGPVGANTIGGERKMRCRKWIEQEGICDLGCIEDSGFVPDECVLVDDACQWAAD